MHGPQEVSVFGLRLVTAIGYGTILVHVCVLRMFALVLFLPV
jgi:hypothetical protein